MIKSRKLLAPTLILASALMIMSGTISHAASGHDGEKCNGDKKHAKFSEHRSFYEGRFLEHKLGKLNLSEDQQAKVKQIVEKQKPLFAEKRKALQISFRALASATATDQYDQKKVEVLAGEQAKLQADLLVLRSNAMHEVYQVLTAEQKQKWGEFQSKDRSRRHDKV